MTLGAKETVITLLCPFLPPLWRLYIVVYLCLMYSNAKHRAKQKITTSSVCPPVVTDIAEEVANLCFNFRGRL